MQKSRQYRNKWLVLLDADLWYIKISSAFTYVLMCSKYIISLYFKTLYKIYNIMVPFSLRSSTIVLDWQIRAENIIHESAMDFWVSSEESIFVVSSSPNKNAGWITRSIPVRLVTMLMIWVWVISSCKMLETKFKLLMETNYET